MFIAVPLPPCRALTAMLVACALPCWAQSEGTSNRFLVESATELPTGGVRAWSPKWSPDGKWIAFALPKADGIGVVWPDGTHHTVLTKEPRSGYRFSWSPDGSQIAFRAAQPKSGPRRYVVRTMAVENGEISSSTEVLPDAEPPLWQSGPDGVRWVVHTPKGLVESQWIRADRARPQVGPPVLVQQGRELWLHDRDKQKRRKISGAVGLNPKWNASHSAVVFDAMDHLGIAKPGEGTPARDLCVGQHPAWSPDGEWIVFQITRDHSHAPDDPRQHTPDTAPHLHDDKTNHQIVDSDLWVIRADGTGRHQLTKTADVLEIDADWSPDGNAIVCADERTGHLLLLKLSRQ